MAQQLRREVTLAAVGIDQCATGFARNGIDGEVAPTQVFLQEYWGLEGLALDAAVVVLAIALAALSFWLVEEPIRTGMRPAGLGSSRPRTRDPRIPRVAFSAMAPPCMNSTL